MPTTRSQDKPLEKVVDNPERVLRKPNMAEQPVRQPEEGAVVPPPTEAEEEGARLNISTDTFVPPPDYYLPDMENTRVSEAKNRAIKWGSTEYTYLIDCPGISKFYGESTLLVNIHSGTCHLFIEGGELEDFPVHASEDPFPLALLGKILASDGEKRTSLVNLPGANLTTIFDKPLNKSQLEDRLQAFSELVGMYAANQISLQHAQLQPKKKAYREVSRYETRGRRLETRIDELIAVFMADNTLREVAGLKMYPLPKIIPVNKEIVSKEQADKYTTESYQEGLFILNTAFDDKGEAYKLPETTPATTAAATTATDRPSRPSTARTQATTTTTSNHGQPRSSSPAFIMMENDQQNPLSVRTSGDTHAGSFIVPTMATNTTGRQEPRNTVTFDNRLTSTASSVNERLMEIANSATAITATNRDDRYTQQSGSQTQGNSYNPGRNNQGDSHKTGGSYRDKTPHNNSSGRTWENSFTNRTCNSCGERGHLQRSCTKTDLYCNFCRTRTHDTAACKSKPKTSTPLESPSGGSYHPAPSPRGHNTSLTPEDPNRSVVPDHITQPSPVPSACNEEMLKAWITRLDQNHAETKETQDQNRFLDNIDVFDGEDKTKCLPWVNRVHQAAMNSSMKFRKALLAKAGPTVFGIVADTPIDIKDLELKQVILANFSDISTPSEAAQKLRTMRMNPDQPIRTYNHYFTAVHEIAYGRTPEKQDMRIVLEDYANSLPEYTANKLSDKIVKENSWIVTLDDAMKQAIKIDQEARQAESMRSRRNASNTTIDTTTHTSVNEVDNIDINYITARQGDSRFNSTMIPGHRRESKEFSPKGKSNNSHQSKPWNNSTNGGNQSKPWNNSTHGGNYNRYRKVNKYRHPAREPRHNIRFEYEANKGDQELMRVLHRMIQYLKGKSDREVDSIKHMPKLYPRNVNEVSEDDIATITIEEIQSTLKEDVNVVYDALVASDFIEEIAEA